MKLPRWLKPFAKQTDANTVTPITSALRLQSPFGWIMEAFGGAWQSMVGIKSTNDILSFSAVYACIQLISADISKLRIKLVHQADDGIWDEIKSGSSAFLPVLRKPNRFQTRIQFLCYWMTSKLIYGNAYALLERDKRGVVVAMYPLDPRGVVPSVAPDGAVYYRLSQIALNGLYVDNDLEIIPASEIIHDRMCALWHPLIGVSPLYACAASASQGIGIQTNSQSFFQNMSRPSGQLTAPGKLNDETAARLKRQFEDGFNGANAGRVFVSGDGLKFEPFTIPAEQAQLIEQQKWTVEDVARAFGVPLYKIQAGQNPTFNNIGALNLEYYGQTLQVHIEGIELLLDEALGLPKLDMGTELDTDGLLRMDPVSRADASAKLIGAAILSPNEARAGENRHPVTGGESPMIQQQNYSLAALAKRDAKDDPFAGAKPAPAPAAANDDNIAADEAAAKAFMEIIKAFDSMETADA